MATDVNPLPEREGSFDNSPSKSFTRKWQVIFDTIEEGTEATAIGAVGLPAIYAAHPDAAGAEITRLRGIQDSAEGEGRRWEVHVEWSTGRGSAGGGAAGNRAPVGPTGGGQVPEGQRNENPLLRSPLIKRRSEYIDFFPEYSPHVDLVNGETEAKLIVNTAGDPFDPAIVFRQRITVITVTRNFATLDFANIDDFEDSVNRYPFDFGGFGIFDAETVWLTFDEVELHRENGIDFWPLTGIFRIRDYYSLTLNTNPAQTIQAGGWQGLHLSQGYRQRNLNAPFPHPLEDIKVGTGGVTPKPLPLDDQGVLIEDPPPPALRKPREFIRVVEKKQRDFDELNFFS